MKTNLHFRNTAVLILLFGLILSSQAQVKIGGSPTTLANSNAVLEIEGTNKGLLLPRLALTSTGSYAPFASQPVAGMTVYNTNTAADVKPGYYYNDGAKWIRIADSNTSDQFDSYAVADYKQSTQNANHGKWLICDGTAVSRTDYAALFAVIGTSFGSGDGVTTFNLPDMRGRVSGATGQAAGVTGATTWALGAKTGEETHTLTIAEMASHTHTDSGHTHTATSTFAGNRKDFPLHGSEGSGWDGGRFQTTDHGVSNTWGYTPTGRVTTTIAAAAANITFTGGNAAHNVMQPTLFTGNVFIHI